MTRIYGASDDLIEFEGDVEGEVNAIGTDRKGEGVLVFCSDGTLLVVQYGKNDDAIWGIVVRAKGTLFDRMEECFDSDADPYSDQAFFKDGLKWAYAANEWERVE